MSKRTAVISGSTVENVILADDGFKLDGFTLVGSETAAIGDTYNPQTGKFTTPAEPVVPPTSEDVDEERDRRIAVGFTFNGRKYQSREFDLANINGAATAAFIAQGRGHLDGDLRWFDPNTDFAWIATDNTLVPMDAPTVIAFGMTAAAWRSANIMAARLIKNRIANGETFDYRSDALWP